MLIALDSHELTESVLVFVFKVRNLHFQQILLGASRTTSATSFLNSVVFLIVLVNESSQIVSHRQ